METEAFFPVYWSLFYSKMQVQILSACGAIYVPHFIISFESMVEFMTRQGNLSTKGSRALNYCYRGGRLLILIHQSLSGWANTHFQRCCPHYVKYQQGRKVRLTTDKIVNEERELSLWMSASQRNRKRTQEAPWRELLSCPQSGKAIMMPAKPLQSTLTADHHFDRPALSLIKKVRNKPTSVFILIISNIEITRATASSQVWNTTSWGKICQEKILQLCCGWYQLLHCKLGLKLLMQNAEQRPTNQRSWFRCGALKHYRRR